VRALRPGGHSRAATSVAGLHQTWFRCGSDLLSRRLGANSNLWRQLQRYHAVHEFTPVVALECVPNRPSGRCGTISMYWGQPWYNPRRVRESRLSWRLDAHRSSLGSEGRIRSPGACSRVATLRESEDCACRGLVACCDPFGGCRMAPKPRTHLRCCHAPCDISRRTSGHGPCLSRETGLRPDASACLGRASFGRCGETCISSGRCL